MVDLGVAFQEFLEIRDDLLRCIDGGGLRQFQVDEQFRPVRR
jgi:hypothetical protein